MTYLDIVNNVLRRLREDTVSDITETPYSTMVGDFVNDAKKEGIDKSRNTFETQIKFKEFKDSICNRKP